MSDSGDYFELQLEQPSPVRGPSRYPRAGSRLAGEAVTAYRDPTGDPRGNTYYGALAERYPWADAADLHRGATFIEANLRVLVDKQLVEGTREIDWEQLEAMGSRLASILGPPPDVDAPSD